MFRLENSEKHFLMRFLKFRWKTIPSLKTEKDLKNNQYSPFFNGLNLRRLHKTVCVSDLSMLHFEEKAMLNVHFHGLIEISHVVHVPIRTTA